ncbi:delta-like protein C isoform X1 [Xiphophorus hellerii]|uniref:delta-like protein C isoform X1 n=2 Tax=Xiphophorus hellerii TaxID=8084 RepID=UPI0013B3CFE0|nr:delta-like protein 3 isoform X1 [Xiphophorus hellerii]
MLRLFLLLLAVPVQTVRSTKAVFELKVQTFSSSRSICDQNRDCRIFFRMCLKHSQSVISPEPPCTYGNASSAALPADPGSISGSAPMKVNVSFKWPGSFSLILEVWTSDSSGGKSTGDRPRLLSRASRLGSQAVGEEWSQQLHQGNQSELSFSYRVVCMENYHGDDCSTLCRPRSDDFGHYRCDAQGRRRCLEGWEGNYCTEPICAGGCGGHRGVCEAPERCRCNVGWEGQRCDSCKRHPGCLHGTCQLPWECSCNEGWGGLYCNQDLNYCTNHRPCQNQASCTNTGEGSYTCSCRPGFSGVDCEIETNECDSTPCRNGGSCTDLLDGYSCACPQGFYGRDCEISAMRCADGPCFNGGTCLEAVGGGYSCRCPDGFTGSNCEKRLDQCSSGPCANGARCLDLGSRVVCQCRSGFTGTLCETNIDDCAGNPCRNAGTCLDGINDFSCSCTLGFSGKDCSARTSPCDFFPCNNGGRCYTHFSGPVCQCPPGFMGARCEYSFSIPSPRPPDGSDASPALIAAVALGLVTLSLLVCAAIHVLRQLRRGRKLAVMSRSVKNDLETVNNRSAVIGGGVPNNGSLAGAPVCSLKEKEAFLLPGGSYKVSNKNAALAEKSSDNGSMIKNKMADCNLAKEEQRLEKNKFDPQKHDSSIAVPPLSFVKDSLYQPVFIVPEPMEQRVFATEVRL